MKMELNNPLSTVGHGLKKFPRYKTNLTYAEDPLRVFSYNTLVAQKHPKKQYLVIAPSYGSGEDNATSTTTRHINYVATHWGLDKLTWEEYSDMEGNIFSRSPWNYCEEVK